MELQYRNIVEMLMEDLLEEEFLDIEDEDSESLISDTICKTLTNSDPLYVRNHIDFFYGVSSEEIWNMKKLIIQRFNIYIKLFREEGDRSWS